MSEVKNEGMEVVAWQFKQNGKWYLGSYTNDHKSNTISAGYPVRELCLLDKALAGYAARDARISELEEEVKTSAECLDMANDLYSTFKRKNDQLRAELAALNAKLDASKFCVNVADDLLAELANQLEVKAFWIGRTRALEVELAAIKAQEPVDGALLDYCEECSHPEFGLGYFFTDDCVRQLYAAPVAKQVVMPDADHSEDVRAMVFPEGYKLVPIEPTKEMMDAALMADCGEIDPRSIIYADYKAMLAASPAAKGGE